MTLRSNTTPCRSTYVRRASSPSMERKIKELTAQLYKETKILDRNSKILEFLVAGSGVNLVLAIISIIVPGSPLALIATIFVIFMVVGILFAYIKITDYFRFRRVHILIEQLERIKVEWMTRQEKSRQDI